MKSKGLFSITLLLLLLLSWSSYSREKQHYYQLKVYHLKTKSQEDRIDRFLKDAYLPALHRMGIKQVGVFKPISEDTDNKLIYVFVSVPKFDQFANIEERLEKDKVYLKAGEEYLNAPYNDPAFTRIESTLMKAFIGMPAPAVPNLTSPRSERIYELRSYEGATEKLSANKVSMFNNGEIDIFTDLNFNAVFYGQVISGSTMPNLVYMTTFNNKAERDEHWKAFGPAYKPMSQLPQYQNNVSKNVTLFLYPTEYSDF
jgi:hypothetical protein